MSRGELVRRVAVGAVGIPLALVVIYLGGWALTALLALIAGGAAWELDLLARARGIRPFRLLVVVGAVGWVLVAGSFGSFTEHAPWALGLTLAVFFLASVTALFRRPPQEGPLASVAVTLMAAVYVGGSLSFAVFLRNTPPGPWGEGTLTGVLLLLFPLAVTWLGDSAAYFGGSLFGRRKLIPSVSPGKTVFGGVAELVVGVVVGALWALLVLPFHTVPGPSALLGAGMGLLLAAGAQAGDLAESLLKREAGVKDSGRLLPGHGGLLDRFDALFLNLPLAWILLLLAGLLS